MGVSTASKFGIRLLDAAFVTVLAAISAYFFRADVLSAAVTWKSAVGIVWATITGVMLVCSMGTSWWMSNLHLEGSKYTNVKLLRRVGRRLPCPYPDAWYPVAITRELKPGMVQEVTVCDKALIVFRPYPAKGSDKWPEAAVLDAYCPHMGAHLVKGGGHVTDDGCIRCPFHGWCFNADGKLVKIEAGDAPPANGIADLRKWPSIEQNGTICVWMSSLQHKAELPPVARARNPAVSCSSNPSSASSVGSATGTTTPTAAAGGCSHDSGDEKKVSGKAVVNAPNDAAALSKLASTSPSVLAARPEWAPWFTPPKFDQLTGPDARYVYHGTAENIVNACLFELPENGADVTHLPALHGEFFIESLRWLLNHKWVATWKPNEDKAWQTDITVDEYVQVRGWTVPGTRVAVTITQAGCSQVFLDMSVPVVGRVFVVQGVTPVSPAQQRVTHSVYADPSVPRAFAKLVLMATVRQFERDVPIWCNKRYQNPPLLTGSDSAIRSYRQWQRIFYSKEGAITFEEAQRAHMAAVLGLPEDASPLDW